MELLTELMTSDALSWKVCIAERWSPGNLLCTDAGAEAPAALAACMLSARSSAKPAAVPAPASLGLSNRSEPTRLRQRLPRAAGGVFAGSAVGLVCSWAQVMVVQLGSSSGESGRGHGPEHMLSSLLSRAVMPACTSALVATSTAGDPPERQEGSVRECGLVSHTLLADLCSVRRPGRAALELPTNCQNLCTSACGRPATQEQCLVPCTWDMDASAQLRRSRS